MSKAKHFRFYLSSFSLIAKELAVLAASWWGGIWRKQNSDEAPVEVTCQACNDCLSWRSRFCRVGSWVLRASVKVSQTLVPWWLLDFPLVGAKRVQI